MQQFAKSAIRVTKNGLNGYSETHAKVRSATSNDPWGPSGTQMSEIAELTYNQQDFIQIVEILDKRLNDKGKHWRHVFKSLTVLHYCLLQGSEYVITYYKDNLYVIKTLREFQFVDEEEKDQGANVRQKAKDITTLLQDGDRLRMERRSRSSMRERMGTQETGIHSTPDGDENASRRDHSLMAQDEEAQLRRALRESKNFALMEQDARAITRAMFQSGKEEKERQQKVEDSNAGAFFDVADPAQTTATPEPVDSLPPPASPFQAQFTGFNPQQQQLQQEMLQTEYMRQQAAYEQQLQQQAAQEEWMRQQMFQQQQQQQVALQQEQIMQQQFLAQQQQAAQRQSLNPFFQLQPQLAVQPTGFSSNNPFARLSSPSPSPSPSPITPTFQFQTSPFSAQTSSMLLTSPIIVSPTQEEFPSGRGGSEFQLLPELSNVAAPKMKEENEQLASLFANKEAGQDSFGNIGALRFGYAHAQNFVVG